MYRTVGQKLESRAMCALTALTDPTTSVSDMTDGPAVVMRDCTAFCLVAVVTSQAQRPPLRNASASHHANEQAKETH